MSWAIKDKGYTQRRACRLVGLEPKTYRYASTRPDDDALRQRLKELASERRRFGYRRLHLLLRREGVVLNWKKLYRLYREERLTVRKRGGRKRALGTRAPMTMPQGRNQRWSLDFVSDTLVSGRKFRMLTVVDDFSRECVALVVDNSLSGIRVARELDQVLEMRGKTRAVDPFFTTKPLGKGTGLGFSMTFGFVRQSGGYLAINSAPGRGTEITLYMPRNLPRTEEGI